MSPFHPANSNREPKQTLGEFSRAFSHPTESSSECQPPGLGGLAQNIKVLAPKADSLSLVPGTHVVGEKRGLPRLVFWPLQTHHSICHTHSKQTVFKRMSAFILALHKSPNPWAFRRVKQKDHKVGASLSYIGRSCLKNKNKQKGNDLDDIPSKHQNLLKDLLQHILLSPISRVLGTAQDSTYLANS